MVKSLRALADSTRLRILRLLQQEDLSVAELQDILAMGQSRISTHLAQLKQAGLVQDRRSGKRVIYGIQTGLIEELHLSGFLRAASREVPEAAADDAALNFVLEKRRQTVRAYFDQLAGRFGRAYLPGRSWRSLTEALLALMPPLVIADLGAGEGTLSLLLAQRAKKVIAVDYSSKMVAYGTGLARKNGVENLEFREGEIERPPIDPASIDLALLSQALHHAEHPETAVAAAFDILKPGGRILILDLLRHSFEEARSLYQDVWLGFSELELRTLLTDAGFENTETSVVDREKNHPHFRTVMAIAWKPAKSG